MKEKWQVKNTPVAGENERKKERKNEKKKERKKVRI